MYFTSREEAKKAIIAQSPAFGIFLNRVIGEQIVKYLKSISQDSEIYLFSGIIRDFLIGNKSALTPRDIDLVVAGNFNTSHLILLQKLFPRKNSFNGIKLTFSNLNIDIWNLKDTWGIKQLTKKPNVNNLLKSAFFNFSTIVYSFKDSKFIFDENFIDFLMSRRIEIVLPDNPNLGLSLFNIYYYTNKLNVQVGDSVVFWLKKHFCHIIDFQQI